MAETGQYEKRSAAGTSPATGEQLRIALGHYPTGIAVVAARLDSELIGMTVSSFNSVSLDPPLILFSIARTCLSIDSWLKAETFAVNLLTENQTEDARRFARAKADKWSATRFRHGITGSPILADALASFECTRYAQYDGGDHLIVLGRVIAIETSASERPLVFYRSGFHAVLNRAD